MDALIRRCFNVSKVLDIFWSSERMFLSFPGCTKVRQFLRNSIRNVCSSPHTLKRRGALIHHLVLDTVVRLSFSLDRLSFPHGLPSPKKVFFLLKKLKLCGIQLHSGIFQSFQYCIQLAFEFLQVLCEYYYVIQVD